MKASRILGAIAVGLALGAAIVRGRAWQRSRPTGPPPLATATAPASVTRPIASISTLDAASTASPGCGLVTAGPRGVSYETKSGRTFHVWGPNVYDANRAYPIVLTFHGWYTNGRDFQKWFKMEDHVEGGAFTVYPDSKGPTWDIDGSGDLDFAADMVEAMSNAYCIDRTHVFALGFSYGGKMVHHLGCKRPSLVRAIAVGDGSWANDADCRALPVLVTHRTRDHDELIAWGRAAAQRWVAIDRCTNETEPVDPAHGCVAYRGCAAAGSVTFCEDTHFDPQWPEDWNHTIREEYRALTWKWFAAVP